MQEYYEKLCKKFPEITFNTGSSLMSGNENKVVINLSSECLKKMANDPEFAKKVEFNLTGAVPGQNRMFAQAKADNAVIHGVTTVIDADGNVYNECGEEVLTYTEGVGWQEKETKAESQVHSALKSTYYEAFCDARKALNSEQRTGGMNENIMSQGNFDMKA